jgi:hypothetical protein
MEYLKLAGKIVLGIASAVGVVAAGNEVTRAFHAKADAEAQRKALEETMANGAKMIAEAITKANNNK